MIYTQRARVITRALAEYGEGIDRKFHLIRPSAATLSGLRHTTCPVCGELVTPLAYRAKNCLVEFAVCDAHYAQEI